MPVASISQELIYFLNDYPDAAKPSLGNCTVLITQYSPLCNPHLRTSAGEKSHEFDAFSDHIRPKYEAFIQSE